MTEGLPQRVISSPRDHVDYDPGNRGFAQSATRAVQIETTDSHKQGESRSIEEASSSPGLNEDSTEQKWPETLSGPTSSEDGYKLSTREHGIDLLSEEIRASIRSLEERMKQLEDGKAQPPGPKADPDAPKDQADPPDKSGSKGPEKVLNLPTRIIPQRRYVGWYEFKNKLAKNEEAYAIEVLVGRAKLYHQRAEEEKKDEVKGGIQAHDQRAQRPLKLGDDACALEASTPKEVPERIRINSAPVVCILQQIDGEQPWHVPTVILRPFKFLVYYDTQLRERYHRLEAKWGTCDSGIALGHGGTDLAKAADQVRDEVETTRPLGSRLMAKDGESPPNQTVASSTAQSESAFRPATGHSTEVPAEVKEDICLKDSLLESTSRSTTEVGNSRPKGRPVMNEEAKKGTESKALTDSIEAFQELRCLIEFIDKELNPVMEAFRARRRKKVHFSDLWYLFRPGDLLYTPLDNKAKWDVARSLKEGRPLNVKKAGARFQEVWRIDATTDGRPNLRAPREEEQTTKKVNSFQLQCYHTDLTYMRAYSTYMYLFKIDEFPGQKDITSLPFYPLGYVANADRLCSKWKARGEAFREFHPFVHKYYIGSSLTSHPNGDSPHLDDLPKHAENIDSQVVIDFSEALTANPGWQVYEDVDPPIGATAAECQEDYVTNFWTDLDHKELYTSVYDRISSDWSIDDKLSDEQRLQDKFMGNRRDVILTEHSELSDEHLILLPNRVFAFVLRNRKFALLTVDGLRPIKPHVDGFNDLKLPKGHKAMVKSLVHNHFMTKGADDDHNDECENDVVRGKGKGLILLLHGAPGVGKTSTAECVAEANGKMLFPITCGDLGTTAADVERELSDTFHLAELWDCVLLLDEADVFLAQRTKYDVKRNSLVSVFLRVLEYFTGILFLTTNRVGAFDEAFKSRIHVSLYYPPLNWERTEAIWRMHMRRLRDKKMRKGINLHIDEAEILAFAKKHYFLTTPKKANWNGRQIRNAFQTATALAGYEAHDHKSDLNKATSSEQATPGELQLKVDHFDKVAWASFEFDRYLSQTRAFTDTELAFQNAERTDHFRSNEGSFSSREQPQRQSITPPATVSTPRSDPRPWTQTQQQQRAPRPPQAPGPLSYAQNIPVRMEASHIPTQNISLDPRPETGYDSSWPETTPWPTGSMMSQVDRPEEQELFAPQLAARRQAMGDTRPMDNSSMYGYGDDDENY